MMARGVGVVFACIALGAAVPAPASALTLKPGKAETGWIALSVPDAGTATSVSLAETAGTEQTPIATQTPSGGRVVVRHATTWRCDRLERNFMATAAYADGTSQTATASVRTPGCGKRWRLGVRRLRGG